MSNPERPIDFDQDPTETLCSSLLARVAEDGYAHAQEVEYVTDEGAMIWMRVVEGSVQHILYRTQVEEGESASVIRGYSLELGEDCFRVQEWVMSEGFTPSDPRSNFQIEEPRQLDHRLVCDLLVDLSEAEIVNPEYLCEYTSTQHKLSSIIARIARLASLSMVQGNMSPELSAAVLGSIGR